jgi:GAF domain
MTTTKASEVPESIVHYVVRTQESVILDDASAENPFSADPYIRRHHARSILCMPLINQAKLIVSSKYARPRSVACSRSTLLGSSSGISKVRLSRLTKHFSGW